MASHSTNFPFIQAITKVIKSLYSFQNENTFVCISSRLIYFTVIISTSTPGKQLPRMSHISQCKSILEKKGEIILQKKNLHYAVIYAVYTKLRPFFRGHRVICVQMWPELRLTQTCTLPILIPLPEYRGLTPCDNTGLSNAVAWGIFSPM